MTTVLNYTMHAGANAAFHIDVSDATGDAVDLTLYTLSASYQRHHESANSTAFVTAGYANGLLVVSALANTTTVDDEGSYLYKVDVNHTGSNTTTRIQEGRLIIKG